jgi:hypothetical protein
MRVRACRDLSGEVSARADSILRGFLGDDAFGVSIRASSGQRR